MDMQTSTDATRPIETKTKHHEVENSMDVLCYATSLVLCDSITWSGTKATSTQCRKHQVHVAETYLKQHGQEEDTHEVRKRWVEVAWQCIQ